MKIEFILLGVIAIVLIVDFLLKGIKKKDTTEKGIEKFEGAFEESIKQSKLHYILGRKRNILTFILLLMLVKPIIHYVFVEEKGEISDIVVNIGKGGGQLYLKLSDGNLLKISPTIISSYYRKVGKSLSKFQRKTYFSISGKTAKREFLDKVAPKNGIYIYDKKGNLGLSNKDGEALFKFNYDEYYYYSRAIPTLKSYYTKYYKSKPYFFAISLGVLLILVFLFNDKIKAR